MVQKQKTTWFGPNSQYVHVLFTLDHFWHFIGGKGQPYTLRSHLQVITTIKASVASSESTIWSSKHPYFTPAMHVGATTYVHMYIVHSYSCTAHTSQADGCRIRARAPVRAPHLFCIRLNAGTHGKTTRLLLFLCE